MKIKFYDCNWEALVLLGKFGKFVPKDWAYRLVKHPSEKAYDYVDTYVATHKPSDTSFILRIHTQTDENLLLHLEIVNYERALLYSKDIPKVSPEFEEKFKLVCVPCVAKYKEDKLANEMAEMHNFNVDYLEALHAVILAAKFAEVDVSEVLLKAHIDLNYGEVAGLYDSEIGWSLSPESQQYSQGFNLNGEYYPYKVAVMKLRDIIKKAFKAKI